MVYRRLGVTLALVLVGSFLAVTLGASPADGQSPGTSFSQVDRILVSTVEDGVQPFYVVRTSSAVSPNGNWVAFTTGGTGIHGVPTLERLYVHNLATGQAWTLDADLSNRFFRLGTVTDEGGVIVSTNVALVAGDDDTTADTYRVGPDLAPELISSGTDGFVAFSELVASGNGAVTASLEKPSPDAATSVVVRDASGGVVVDGDFDDCAPGSCQLSLSDDGRTLLVARTGPEPGDWLGNRLSVYAASGLGAKTNGDPFPSTPAAEAGSAHLHTNWDGSAVLWAPYPGDSGLVMMDRTTQSSRSLQVDGTVRPLDLSADGQFLLAEVQPDGLEPAVTLIDLGTGDSFAIAQANLAEGVALADFGRSVLWGDQAPTNSRLFVDRFEHQCDVVGAERNATDELVVCSNGRTLGHLGDTAAGSASWQAPRGAVDLLATDTGWYVADADGYVMAHGNAGEVSAIGGAQLAQPIVAFIGDPAQTQTWQVAADGGVFAFGLTQYYGSTGDIALNQPIVTAMATPNLDGYWLVASDGGVFSFGSAQFHGSTGAIRLDSPISAAVPTNTGDGYWLIAEDGGVFTFGDATFVGSAAGTLGTGERVVDAGQLPPGRSGYWLVTNTGRFIDFSA